MIKKIFKKCEKQVETAETALNNHVEEPVNNGETNDATVEVEQTGDAEEKPDTTGASGNLEEDTKGVGKLLHKLDLLKSDRDVLFYLLEREHSSILLGYYENELNLDLAIAENEHKFLTKAYEKLCERIYHLEAKLKELTDEPKGGEE